MSVFRYPLRNARLLARRCSSSWRALPDFLILGAQKSGSTSLHHLLARHPQVVSPFLKETNFFMNPKRWGGPVYPRGASFYRSFFPLQGRLKPGQLTFESSVGYLCHPEAPPRIREMLPEVRMLVVLRNPVERAVSHYYHQVRAGVEARPLLEALQSDQVEWANPNEGWTQGSMRYSYLRRGFYAEQLKRYFSLFGREQLFILKSETFFDDPATALGSVAEFLGVDPEGMPRDYPKRNVGVNREEVPDEVSAWLQDFYQPHNRALIEILGEEYAW